MISGLAPGSGRSPGRQEVDLRQGATGGERGQAHRNSPAISSVVATGRSMKG
jgi:hypothetical protein